MSTKGLECYNRNIILYGQAKCTVLPALCIIPSPPSYLKMVVRLLAPRCTLLHKWEKSAKEAREKPNSNRDLKDSLLKMVELKRVTSKYFPPDEVQRILLTGQVQCQIKGNNLPLDQAVEEFGKKVQVREAMDYLKS